MTSVGHHFEDVKFQFKPPYNSLIIINFVLLLLGTAFIFKGYGNTFADLRYVLAGMSLYCFIIIDTVYYFQKKCFDFYETYLICYQRTSKNKEKIFYTEIIGFDIVEEAGEDSSWDVLYFTANSKSFEINSHEIKKEDFIQIQQLITKNAIRNDSCSRVIKRKNNVKWGFGLMIIAGILGSLNYLIHNEKETHPPSVLRTLDLFQEQ